MTHVFVYGTLMRRGENHAVLERLGARFVARARTHQRRTVVDLGPYPALLPRDEPRDGTAPLVDGELYELSEAALPALDDFEGSPDLYVRERIALTTEEGFAEAWVYVLAKPDEDEQE